MIRGYLDVRSVPTAKLEEHCQHLVKQGRADKIAVVGPIPRMYRREMWVGLSGGMSTP